MQSSSHPSAGPAQKMKRTLGTCALKSDAHTHRSTRLTHTHTQGARTRTYTPKHGGESEGLFSVVKRALIELFKGPVRETTGTSVCVCVCVCVCACVCVRVIVVMKVQGCACDCVLYRCLTVVNCAAAIS